MSYALKFIDPYRHDPNWNPKNEAEVLSVLLQMEHPNLLRYFGNFHVHMGGKLKWLVVCTEVCTGSLQEFLTQQNGSFRDQNELERITTFWDILRQILKGWKLCHLNNLIHRDIKLSNSKTHSSLFNLRMYSLLYCHTTPQWTGLLSI